MNNNNIHKLFLLASTVAVLIGVVFVTTWSGRFSFVSLKFFTIQSNILVLACFIHRLTMYNRKSVLRNYLLISSLMAISITGLVYNFVLVPIVGAPIVFSDYGNFATHLLSMLLILVNYFVFEEKGVFGYKHMLVGMAFPALYWVVFISIGGIIDFHPYFFMNPGLIGWPMTFVWFGILLLVFALIGFGIVAFDKRGKSGTSP